MKFKLNFKSSVNLGKLRDDIDKRVTNTQRAIGRYLSERTADEVRERVPSGGDPAWMSVYKNSIVYREHEDGKGWSVAGIAKTNIASHDAKTTILKSTATTDAGAILNQYNNGEWPLDLLPALVYNEAAVVRVNLSESAVEAARNAILPLLSNAESALQQEGLTASPTSKAVFTTGEYFDFRYMTYAMELGLPGHPLIRPWSTARSLLITSGDSWAKGAKSDINDALLGKDLPKVETISAAEVDKLEQIRNSTWP